MSADPQAQTNSVVSTAPEKKRDWWALGISLASLAISLATALSTLVPRDDIRVMIDRTPTLFFDKTSVQAYGGKPQLSFINSGNRPAGITGLGLSIGSAKKSQSGAFECDQTSDVPFDAPPFVLNPGDIRIVEAGAKDAKIYELPLITNLKDGTMKFHNPGLKSGDQVLFCLNLNLAMPDSYIQTWKRPAYVLTVRDNNGEFRPLFEQNKPIIINASRWQGILQWPAQRASSSP